MKNARHQQILLLIRQYDIETQEELADLLNKTGFTVTQATVSRDIRQLQLQKVHTENGRQKYVQSAEGNIDLSLRYKRVLKDAYVSMDISGNIIVLRTISGMAMAAAAALDSLDWREVLGCIAGDDTIMCILRSPEDGESFINKVNELLR
ncbi:MAG: arginine repressor [Lachnospiraceae bacterium]|nr:arginine repressor [Lachnospiraceae bacterium]